MALRPLSARRLCSATILPAVLSTPRCCVLPTALQVAAAMAQYRLGRGQRFMRACMDGNLTQVGGRAAACSRTACTMVHVT